MENFDFFSYSNTFCFGAKMGTLMSICDGLMPYILRQNMEKTRPMREEMDEKLFIFRQSRHLIFVVNMIKVLFPICTLTWLVNNHVSGQG